MLEKWQIKKIYGKASRLGLVNDKENPDLLHELVFSLTGQEHISLCSNDEFETIIKELQYRCRQQEIEEPPRKPYKKQKFEDSGRGKMSDGQRRKVWRLMYQLEELDKDPSSAKLGDRLCGIIKKELHIDCTSKQPFRWLTYQQGSKLIEKLKKYVANAQRRKDGVGRKED